MIPDLLVHVVFGLAAGLLIGCAGIGGVILVPLLSYAGSVEIHNAIAGAMFAYLISGTIGTIVYAREGSIRWDLAAAMWLGAMPAALAGALAASILPTTLLEFCIGILTAASGVHALIKPAEQDRASGQSLSRSVLTSVGAVTGFLSALTGTGGPLVLIPILLWLRLPVLTAIGLAQAIQLPIAALATGGNTYTGTLDLSMGLAIGAGISFGTWAGGRLAHRLPQATLRTIVSVLLILVGALILLRLGLALMP